MTQLVTSKMVIFCLSKRPAHFPLMFIKKELAQGHTKLVVNINRSIHFMAFKYEK